MAEMIVHRSRHSTGFGHTLRDLILVTFFSSLVSVVGCLIWVFVSRLRASHCSLLYNYIRLGRLTGQSDILILEIVLPLVQGLFP